MTMSEKELRLLWHHQLFDPTRLLTTDGRRVAVFAPGTENSDGGPDFHGARVQIGDTAYVGDVEIHLRTRSWMTHRHQTDPHYNTVVLHVVFSDDGSISRTAAGKIIPILPVGQCLTGTPVSPAPFHAPRVPATTLLSAARQRGIERLEEKMRNAETRLVRIAGSGCSEHEAWDQLLYEGLMEAMGYAKNRTPFLLLARGVTLKTLRRYGLHKRETLEAVLFGAAGLLPSPRLVRDPESRAYVRALHRRWEIIRPGLRAAPLHPADWLFFRLRPANFPPVRLAAVAGLLHSLFGRGQLRNLLALGADDTVAPGEWWRRSLALFAVSPDPYWSRHVRFGAPAGRRRNWIGRERLLDIAANLLIPSALLLCRRTGRGPEGLRRCATLLMHLPPAACGTLVRSFTPSCTGPLRPANLLEHQGLIALSLRT